ncbi:MAG: hypothetical protein PHD82_01180 [Candidatus Riflebacteria bacterium]|nr:hypothetical protein [Candidatus Riflebacteria bacterium]
MSPEAKPAPQKGKKAWKAEEEVFLTPIQKIIIGAVLSFFPFIFGIVLPMYTRDYYVKNLKIPADFFLNAPEEINLVSTGEVGATYKVKIHGYEFKIPERFTPSRINDYGAEFRADPRKEARYIYILAEPTARTINFTSSGLGRWFMPTQMSRFLPMILNASWHPIRLMFKAQFYASEGITSRIFAARWDAHNRGYIFPTPGQKGYLNRGFRTNYPGYFEFLMVDPVKSLTLREWVNLAMKIKPPDQHEIPPDADASSSINLEALIRLSHVIERENDALSGSLGEFFRTRSPEWLIPVAIVMQNREYFPELIDLHKQYLNRFRLDSPYRKTWNEILDNAVSKTVKVDIDPQLGLKELNVYCKNLTNLEIGQVWIKFVVLHPSGDKSFLAPLLPFGRILPQDEKHLTIKTPDDISLAGCTGIDSRIIQIDFVR